MERYYNINRVFNVLVRGSLNPIHNNGDFDLMKCIVSKEQMNQLIKLNYIEEISYNEALILTPGYYKLFKSYHEDLKKYNFDIKPNKLYCYYKLKLKMFKDLIMKDTYDLSTETCYCA